MAKKTKLGIFLIAGAVLFAVFNISRTINQTEEETTTIEVTKQECVQVEKT